MQAKQGEIGMSSLSYVFGAPSISTTVISSLSVVVDNGWHDGAVLKEIDNHNIV